MQGKAGKIRGKHGGQEAVLIGRVEPKEASRRIYLCKVAISTLVLIRVYDGRKQAGTVA